MALCLLTSRVVPSDIVSITVSYPSSPPAAAVASLPPGWPSIATSASLSGTAWLLVSSADAFSALMMPSRILAFLAFVQMLTNVGRLPLSFMASRSAAALRLNVRYLAHALGRIFWSFVWCPPCCCATIMRHLVIMMARYMLTRMKKNSSINSTNNTAVKMGSFSYIADTSNEPIMYRNSVIMACGTFLNCANCVPYSTWNITGNPTSSRTIRKVKLMIWAADSPSVLAMTPIVGRCCMYLSTRIETKNVLTPAILVKTSYVDDDTLNSSSG
mmetsp:Transcript_4009/g.9142  ORF Transcript_4009/g.9142 Transcript_4009/m.9142 type:complete len:272 (-) Transcript_4009:2567-3382(-)